MQAIKEELGEGQDGENGEDDLEAPPAWRRRPTLRQAESELLQLRKMTQQAPAYGSSRASPPLPSPWSKEAFRTRPASGGAATTPSTSPSIR